MPTEITPSVGSTMQDRGITNAVPKKAVSALKTILEVVVPPAGVTLVMTKALVFKGVVRVGAKFVVYAEQFETEIDQYGIEIVFVRRQEYVPKEARYLGTAMSGNDLLHFYYGKPGFMNFETSL